MRSSVSRSATTLYVSSVQPSSTMTSSQHLCVCLKRLSIALRMNALWLNVGIITDTFLLDLFIIAKIGTFSQVQT